VELQELKKANSDFTMASEHFKDATRAGGVETGACLTAYADQTYRHLTAIVVDARNIRTDMTGTLSRVVTHHRTKGTEL
jgi:hypothetical protein